MTTQTRTLLAGTAIATLLLIPGLAAAQSAQPSQGSFNRAETQGAPAVPGGQNYSQSMERLFQSAQRLRESIQAMAGQPAGERRNQAMAQAREALLHTQQAMVQLPAELRTGQNFTEADARLKETQAALQGDQADPQRARGAVDAYLVLVPRMQADAARLDRSGTAAGGPGGGTSGAVSGGSAGMGAQTTAASPAASGMPLARVSNLIGTDLTGPDGRKVGEIENLLVDRNGQVRGVVVEWGGFLGLGDREAVVPVERVQLGERADDKARIGMTREELEKLPRYDRNRLDEYSRQNNWGEGLRAHR